MGVSSAFDGAPSAAQLSGAVEIGDCIVRIGRDELSQTALPAVTSLANQFRRGLTLVAFLRGRVLLTPQRRRAVVVVAAAAALLVAAVVVVVAAAAAVEAAFGESGEARQLCPTIRAHGWHTPEVTDLFMRAQELCAGSAHSTRKS